MFSSESDLFEIEENYDEFQELCSKLKDHAFSSPWQMFFKRPEPSEFISEVSEFVIEDVDVDVKNANLNATNPILDDSLDVSNRGRSPNDVSFDKRKVSRFKESLLSAQEDTPIENIKDFDIFFITSSSDMPVLFKLLDVPLLNDNAISLLLNAFLHYKDQIGIATATALVHHVIFPLVFKMKKNSSRFFLTTILKFAEAYPKAVVDEVMIPYSNEKTSNDILAEILFQVAKTNLPNEYVSYAIKNLLEHALPVENTFGLLQCLLERKIHLEPSLYDLLLKKLLSWTTTCNKNVKFTKLLTSILSAYGNEFNEQQILMCDEVVKGNKTIIKKAAENLLKKLKHEI